MPVILVTHDLDDAARLADRMCVLNGGKIREIGTVEEVMARPASPLIAELLDLAGEDAEPESRWRPRSADRPVFAAKSGAKQKKFNSHSRLLLAIFKCLSLS